MTKEYEKKCKYVSLTEQIMGLINDPTKHLKFKDFIRRSSSLNNPITGNEYNGMNVMNTFVTVMNNDFKTFQFITYMQGKAKGLKLKKGSKACPVFFYKEIKNKEENEEEDDSYLVMKKYSVFNLDQFEMTEDQKKELYVSIDTSEEEKIIISENDKIEKLKALAEIKITKETQAFFSPLGNYIHMPTLDAFENKDHWHDVLMHELTHWTGHESRLNRPMKGKTNSSEYSHEELIAELGSFFLCLDLGIEKDLESGASYLKSWLSRSNDKDIFSAMSKALKAVNYLYDLAGL